MSPLVPLGIALAALGLWLALRLIRETRARAASRAGYFDAVKRLPPSQIEAIDMARRGIHNEGASILQDRLTGKASVDTDTARRLFTLICVLHWG